MKTPCAAAKDFWSSNVAFDLPNTGQVDAESLGITSNEGTYENLCSFSLDRACAELECDMPWS